MPSTLTYQGRLPGVLCQAALPPTGEEPLRLDVAAFVGFAERGPLNTPVALEDVSQYRAIFGGDLLVARDGGQPAYANLPQAVRSFFDNGGRRCYVVRVAGEGARPNRFRLPGLVAWRKRKDFEPIVAKAAWAGRWSDVMSIGTQLRSLPLRVTGNWLVNVIVEVDVEVPTGITIEPGVLLRLRFDKDRPFILLSVRQVLPRGATTAGAVLLTAISQVDPASASTNELCLPWPSIQQADCLIETGWQTLPTPQVRVTCNWEVDLEISTLATVQPGDLLRLRLGGEGHHLVFMPIRQVRRRGEAATTARGIPVTVMGEVDPALTFATQLTREWPSIQKVERLTEKDWQALQTPQPVLSKLPKAEGAGYALYLQESDAADPGDLLRLTFKGLVAFFRVETVGLAPRDSSPHPLPERRLTTTELLWQSALPPASSVLVEAERLSFDLHIHEVHDGENAVEIWPELRFGMSVGSGPVRSKTEVRSSYWADVLTQHNLDPLNGVPFVRVDQVSDGLVLWPECASPERPAAGLQRSLRLRAPTEALLEDGSLYLPLGMSEVLKPEEFAGPLPDSNPASALSKDGLDKFDPVDLFLSREMGPINAHDLLNEAEYALYLNTPPRRLPKLHSLLAIDEIGSIAIPDAVHRAWAFHQAVTLVEPTAAPKPWPRTDEARFHNCPLPREIVRSFYLAVLARDEAKARSYLTAGLQEEIKATMQRLILGASCAMTLINPLSFDVGQPAYVGQAAFVPGTLLFDRGANAPPEKLVHWFTLIPRASSWAIACINRPASGERVTSSGPQLEALPELVPVDKYQLGPLLKVHSALLNLCAARADMLAVLSLPRHFTGREALDWHQQLRTTPALLGGAILSYAAVYHPWLSMREEVTPQLAPWRDTPPDGAICGMIAARELARGPWIAPANVPLRGVLGLVPELTAADEMELFDAQFNVTRRQPGQFVTLSAHTLSLDPLLVQLSVRRLLIYLRKLALRHGMRYVFESNTARFRQQVQIAFERTLTQLLQLGALNAFQVVADASLNTFNDIDNGRFLIALKVAPTLPIEFITVVMLRSGENLLEVLER